MPSLDRALCAEVPGHTIAHSGLNNRLFSKNFDHWNADSFLNGYLAISTLLQTGLLCQNKQDWESNLRPRVNCFKIKLRACKDHNCKVHVCLEYVCQDHVCQVHVCLDEDY